MKKVMMNFRARLMILNFLVKSVFASIIELIRWETVVLLSIFKFKKNSNEKDMRPPQ